MSVKLLCMAPAGGLIFYQDVDGFVFHARYGTERFHRQPASHGAADAAVDRYGWRRVNQWFDTWNALNRYRMQLAAEIVARFPEMPIDDYDEQHVRAIIKQASNAKPDRVHQACDLLWSVLERSTILLTHHHLRVSVLSTLRSLYDLDPEHKRGPEPSASGESPEHRCSHPSSVAGSGWWTCPECQRDWTVVSWPGAMNQPGVRRWMKVVYTDDRPGSE